MIDLLGANTSPADLMPHWLSATGAVNGSQRTTWLEYGLQLGCLPTLPLEELQHLILDSELQADRIEILYRARRFDFLEGGKETFDASLDALLERRALLKPSDRRVGTLDLMAIITETARYAIALAAPESAPLFTLWQRAGIRNPPLPELAEKDGSAMLSTRLGPGASRFARLAFRAFTQDARLWATTIGPWDELVELLRSAFGDRWVAAHFANVASGIRSSSETCIDASDLFDTSIPLCRRARYARLRAGNPQWWTTQLQRAKNSNERMLVCLLWFTWASAASVEQSVGEFDKTVLDLEPTDWERLLLSVKDAIGFTGKPSGGRNRDFELRQLALDDLSFRTATLLKLRARPVTAQNIYTQKLREYSGHDLQIVESSHASAVGALSTGRGDWSKDLRVIARAFSKDVISEPYIGHYFFRSGLFAGFR